MVSFNCECCGDVITKGKIKNHANRCRIGALSCLDCSTTFRYVVSTSMIGSLMTFLARFPSKELDAHTSCISEAAKYGHGKGNSGKKRKQPEKKKQEDEAQKEAQKKAKQAAEEAEKKKAELAAAKKEMDAAKKAYKEKKKAYKKLRKQVE